MIWLSEKRDVFMQNFFDPVRRKFYLWRVLFSEGITVTEYCLGLEISLEAVAASRL
ncbi:hypothetical protein ACIOWK_30035 [Pseudomonas protegens]|uniref:hypothetical protein n=1 Tax=Pseudomonas protegens TaxID=380021 RepID=UPI003814541F